MLKSSLSYFLLVLGLIVLTIASISSTASAETRLDQRGLTMVSSTPGDYTSYTLSFKYMTTKPVGSVDMQFCVNPIPYLPCVKPSGLDVSMAQLSQQTGATGYSLDIRSDNHIVMTRSSQPVQAGQAASYTFENMKNPLDPDQAFSIRLKTHASSDATGPQIDFGSVRGQVTRGISIETQVPPMLIFCLAEYVELDCANSNEVYYHDMGELNDKETLTAQSQMAVGTNASGGFAITVEGSPLAAGPYMIDSPDVAAFSQPGTNQFGINLVANSSPNIGLNPQGVWANAQPINGYGTTNMYKFVSGDVVASSPNVSLMKRFTVSYIANVSSNLRPGIYTTTITFIASGRF